MKLALATLLVTLASAAPVRRAAWNDPYIKEPNGFRLQRIGGCAYQLSFNRDTFDSRYVLSFEAAYGSSSRAVEPIQDNSNLAISTSGGIYTIPPYTLDFAPFTLSVLPFADACSSTGEAPTSLIVKARLGASGYTYENEWDSPPITPVDGALAAPANVRVNGETASWDAVEGASSYYVLTRFPTYASELGSDVPAYQTRDVSGTTSSIPGSTERIAVVAKNADGTLSDVTKVVTADV